MSDDPNYDRKRLKSGWIDVNRDEGGVWRISWAPDEGVDGWPGRTYSPADSDLPEGYPGSQDKDALIEWGTTLWKDV